MREENTSMIDKLEQNVNTTLAEMKKRHEEEKEIVVHVIGSFDSVNSSFDKLENEVNSSFDKLENEVDKYVRTVKCASIISIIATIIAVIVWFIGITYILR